MTNSNNILIVDDDPALIQSLTEILISDGSAVFSAVNGRAALEILKNQSIMVALLDLNLPDVTGLNILKQIKKISPDTECIIVTAFASQETAIETLNLGAFSYFEKPYDIQRVLHCVHQAINKYNTNKLLSESQEKYRDLFEHASTPMFRIVMHGNHYLEVNQAFCELFEYTFDEVQKLTHEDFFADLGISDALYERIQKEKIIRNLNLDLPGKGKKKHHCLVSLKLHSDGGYISGSITDITGNQQLADALRDSEDKFTLAFKLSPYAITITTHDKGRFLDVNDAFTAMTGYTRDEALRSSSLNLNLWADPQDRDEVIRDLQAGKKVIGREYEFKKKNGEILTGLFSTDFLTIKGNRYLISTINDISERKAAEKALSESEDKFKWLYLNAPVPYHILSPRGIITDVNQRWCDVLEYKKEAVIGKEIFSFMVEEEQALAKKSFQQKLRSGQSYIEGNDRRYRTKNGQTKVFRSFDFFVFDSNKQVISVQTTIEDITRQRQAEDQQNRALERMRSLVSILQYPAKNSQDFLDYALDEALRLTRSKLGYIFFYDEDKKEFTLNTWSKGVMKECSITDPQNIYQLEKTGVWGEAVRQRKAIILNDFEQPNPLKKVYPEGHAHLQRFLTTPILSDGRIVATVGVANKGSDYDESDSLQLSLLMESVWKSVERNRAITALRENEAKLRSLIDATEDIVILKDAEFRHIMANQTALDYFRKSEEEILGKTDFDLMPAEGAQGCRQTDQRALEENHLLISQEIVNNRFYETRKFPVRLGETTGVGAYIRDITDRINAEASIRLQSKALESTANAIVITTPDGLIEWANPAFTQLTGYTLQDAIGHNPSALVKSGWQDNSFYSSMWETIQKGKIWKGVLINRKKNGSLYTEEMTITPLLDDSGNILHFIAIKEDITEREQRERELTIIADVSAALRIAQNRSEMLPMIMSQLLEQLKMEAATLVMLDADTDEMIIELGGGLWVESTGLRVPPKTGLSYKVLESGQTYVNNADQNDPDSYYKKYFQNCTASAAVPMQVQDDKIGVIFIGANRKIEERDIRLLRAIADIAANALHRTSLHEKTLNKVMQLDALRVIDQAINTSFDLAVTLSVILKQSQQLLGCDNLMAFLSEANTMGLKYAACTGNKCRGIDHLNLHLGSGIAGKAIISRKVVVAGSAEFEQLTDNERFIAGLGNYQTLCAIPLTVKGEIKGVLMGLFTAKKTFNDEWYEIAQTLAAQTAIAIDNHELFDNLQQSTVNLSVAYDETIEGWAKALELRDQETEGHSQRVTKMTIDLAYAMGVKDEAIGDMMRGALLHDIGKMGVPDAILNKPGKLTEEEWQQIYKHPQFAYDMLSAIKYLKSATDIPYCHHEKWDGSGYPRGLKGEEIPLSARIFAVVDVWDALTSDRPYRKAWSKMKARQYMQEQAGKHFDPQIVKIFLKQIIA